MSSLQKMKINYRPGQAVIANFVAAQHFGPWAAGLGGSWSCQTTKDNQNANMTRQNALGPQVGYQYCAVIFKLGWEREFDCKNYLEGDKVWLEVIMPL